MNFSPGIEQEFQQFASHFFAVWNHQTVKIIANQINENKERRHCLIVRPVKTHTPLHTTHLILIQK